MEQAKREEKRFTKEFDTVPQRYYCQCCKYAAPSEEGAEPDKIRFLALITLERFPPPAVFAVVVSECGILSGTAVVYIRFKDVTRC